MVRWVTLAQLGAVLCAVAFMVDPWGRSEAAGGSAAAGGNVVSVDEAPSNTSQNEQWEPATVPLPAENLITSADAGGTIDTLAALPDPMLGVTRHISEAVRHGDEEYVQEGFRTTAPKSALLETLNTVGASPDVGGVFVLESPQKSQKGMDVISRGHGTTKGDHAAGFLEETEQDRGPAGLEDLEDAAGILEGTEQDGEPAGLEDIEDAAGILEGIEQDGEPAGLENLGHGEWEDLGEINGEMGDQKDPSGFPTTRMSGEMTAMQRQISLGDEQPVGPFTEDPNRFRHDKDPLAPLLSQPPVPRLRGVKNAICGCIFLILAVWMSLELNETVDQGPANLTAKAINGDVEGVAAVGIAVSLFSAAIAFIVGLYRHIRSVRRQRKWIQKAERIFGVARRLHQRRIQHFLRQSFLVNPAIKSSENRARLLRAQRSANRAASTPTKQASGEHR